MNLDYLEAKLTAFVRDAGEDPEDPAPRVAWEALLHIATTPPMIDDLGDDFLRFEAVVVDDERVEISITRELTEAEGHDWGAVGYSFELARADSDVTMATLIESATEPDHLPLSDFITAVTDSAAFALLVGVRRPRRSWRVSVVDNG